MQALALPRIPVLRKDVVVAALHEVEPERERVPSSPAGSRALAEEASDTVAFGMPLTPGTVLALQRMAGNAAVARLVANRRLQRLRVSDEHGERDLAIGEGPDLFAEADGKATGARAEGAGEVGGAPAGAQQVAGLAQDVLPGIAQGSVGGAAAGVVPGAALGGAAAGAAGAAAAQAAGAAPAGAGAPSAGAVGAVGGLVAGLATGLPGVAGPASLVGEAAGVAGGALAGVAGALGGAGGAAPAGAGAPSGAPSGAGASAAAPAREPAAPERQSGGGGAAGGERAGGGGGGGGGIAAVDGGGGGGGGGGERIGPPPAAGELATLDSDDTESAEHPQPEEEEIAEEEPDTGEMERSAEGIDEATSGSPAGGGLLESVLQSAVSFFRGLADSAKGLVRSSLTRAVSAVKDGAKAVWGFVKDTAKSAFGALKSGFDAAKTAVTSVLGGCKKMAKAFLLGKAKELANVIRNARGGLRDRVLKALKSGNVVGAIMEPINSAVQSVVSGIQGRLTSITQALSDRVTGVVDRITGVVTGVSDRLTGAVTAVSTRIQGVVTTAQAAVDGVLSSIQQRVSGMGTVIGEVVGWLVDKVLGFVRRFVAGVANFARGIVANIERRITGVIQRIVSRIMAAAERVKSFFAGLGQRIWNLITRVFSAIPKIAGWIIDQITPVWMKILAAAGKFIGQLLMKALLKWLEPKIKELLSNPALQPPNAPGAPSSEQIQQGAQQGLQQSMAKDLLTGILNPGGDHISIGISGGVSGAYGLKVGVQTGWALDILTWWARGELGIFLTRSAAITAGVGGEGEVSADASLGVGWGTVVTYGDNPDIAAAGGGYNVTAGAGVSANVHEGLGISAGRGYGVSVQANIPTGAPTSPSTPSTPSTPTPPTPPPTPPTPQRVPIGQVEVRFGTQQADVTDTEAAKLEGLAQSVGGRTRDGDTYEANIVAEASRRWRGPGRGRTSDEENKDLSARRAASTTSAFRAAVGRVAPWAHGSISAEAVGSAPSSGAHPDDNPPERRRAVVSAVQLQSTVPGQPGGAGGGPAPAGGGGPAVGAPPPGAPAADREPKSEWLFGAKEAAEVGAGVAPASGLLTGAQDPLTAGIANVGKLTIPARPMVGFDSTASVGVGVGGGGGVDVSVSGGLAYSWPLFKRTMGGLEQAAIRTAITIFKLGMDVAGADVPGLARDVLGVVGPALDEICDGELIGPFVNTAIDMPAG